MRLNMLVALAAVGLGGCASNVETSEEGGGTDAAASTGVADDGEPGNGTADGSGAETTDGSGSSGGESSSAEASTSGVDASTGEGSSTGVVGETEQEHPMRTLFVADETAGVGLWLDAGALTENVGPDAVLGGITGTPMALMRYQDRLVVATDDPSASLLFFDDLGGLADGDTPDDVLSAEAIGGAIEPIWFEEPEVWVEPDGDLWIGRYASFQRLVGAAADGSSFTGSVSFGHPWQQLVSAAVIPDADVLVGAQISGAGLVAWNEASTAVGTVDAPSFTVVEGGMPDAVHRYGDRLVVGGNGLMIWHDAAGIGEGTAPDLVLGPDNGIDARVAHVFVSGDALFASMPAGGRVAVFFGLDDLDASAVPDLVLGQAIEPRRAMLDDAGDLWVVDRNGVLRYRDLIGEGEMTIKVNASALDPTDALVVTP